jgi:hypothetical protein
VIFWTVASAGGFFVVFLAPVEWWGRLHGQPIPEDWERDPQARRDGVRHLSRAGRIAELATMPAAGKADRGQLCNGRGVLQLHHRTYERVGDERLDDLTVLCKPMPNAMRSSTRRTG